MTTTKTAAATITTSMNNLDSSFPLNQQQHGSPSGNAKQLMSAAAAVTAANVLSPSTPQLCCSSTGSDNISPDNKQNNTTMHSFLPCLPPKIPRSTIHASPMEHLILHDRHLLKIDEYNIRETEQPHSSSSLHYMGERPRDSSKSCRLPPVPTEICIPASAATTTPPQKLSSPSPPTTGKQHPTTTRNSSNDDNQSWISNSYSSCLGQQDYKTLYFSSQKDMYRLEQRNASVVEENRLLKRQLFEMQRQLYSYRRNNPVIITTTSTSTVMNTSHKRRKISSNADANAIATASAAEAPWSVPPSNLPQRRGTVSVAAVAAAAAAQHVLLSQGGGDRHRRGHVIVANSNGVIKTPVQNSSNNNNHHHHHQAIRFRRVSVGDGLQGVPSAGAGAAGRAAQAVVVAGAVPQHLVLPRLTHAISTEEGDDIIHYKSG